MRLVIYVSSFILIIAGGGGYTFGTQNTAVKGIYKTLIEKSQNEVERLSTGGTGTAESTNEKGGYTSDERIGSGNTGNGERPAGEATSSSEVQTSLGSGEDYLPDLAERKRRVTAGEEAAKNRAVNSASMLNDNRSYGFVGSFDITAYTAGYESTQKKKGEKGYGVTATGTYVKEGRTIAADWSVLPPGTVVEIEGLEGTYVVEDKGGGVKGNHIDLYIESLQQALKWGRQQRSVWVVEWGV